MLQLPTSLLGISQGEAAKRLGCDCHRDLRYVGGFRERIDPLLCCANETRVSLLRSGPCALKQGLGNKARISCIHRRVQGSLCNFTVPLTGLPVYLEFCRCPKHGNLGTFMYVQVLLRGKPLNDRHRSPAFRLVDESLRQEKTDLFSS